MDNKVCKICGATETSGWYSGPICRKCYRKEHFKKTYIPKQFKTTKKCKLCGIDFLDNTSNQMALYCCTEHMQTANSQDPDKQAIKRQYDIDHRENKRRHNAAYFRRRLETDILFRLSCSLRSRLVHAIKNNQKSGSAVRDLGCSIEELKSYLESKFQPGMTWENYGLYGWHIDHIQPLSKFDLGNPEQFKVACHYTNLQPLWAEENLKKGSR